MNTLELMNILIVDDSADMCFSTKYMLHAEGYPNVFTVLSAKKALALLNSHNTYETNTNIDIILMDVYMPGIHGVDACRRIKANSNLCDIPIIMVTGNSEESVLIDAFAAGAIDYITKPAKPYELIARIRSALLHKHQADLRKQREKELSELTSQLQLSNRHLEHLSMVDAVTGLSTRRCFDSALSAEWQRTCREGEPLTVMMIDSDNFKAFNDTYGHPQGDKCLRQIGQVLRGVVGRPGDVVARYGGEEFGIILPFTDFNRCNATCR